MDSYLKQLSNKFSQLSNKFSQLSNKLTIAYVYNWLFTQQTRNLLPNKL